MDYFESANRFARTVEMAPTEIANRSAKINHFDERNLNNLRYVLHQGQQEAALQHINLLW